MVSQEFGQGQEEIEAGRTWQNMWRELKEDAEGRSSRADLNRHRWIQSEEC